MPRGKYKQTDFMSGKREVDRGEMWTRRKKECKEKGIATLKRKSQYFGV